MLRYVKLSLLIHFALFAILVLSFYFTPQPKVERLKFVVLPKGTGMDHVLTKAVADKMTQPPGQAQKKEAGERNSVQPTPSITPSTTPAATPEPAISPTPQPPRATPNETPAVANRATPRPTAQVTATPKASPTTKPNESEKDERPASTPKPTSTPSKSATPKPTAKASPSPAAGGKPIPKEKEAAKSISTPKKPPTPTPRQLASAYDLTKGQAAGRDPRLPRQTPAGATAADEPPAGKQAGVPGVEEGVEGAPLALNTNQSALPQLYTNRAILLLQRNFLVPDGVNDPDLTCIVEWEISSDGSIKNEKIVKSTGNTDYDQRALDAVKKTANLGSLPSQFAGKSVWVSLPFIYGQ